MTRKNEALLDVGRKMIYAEAQALMTIATSLGDAFLDALDYAADIVKDNDVEKRIIIEVQPVNEDYVNPDYVK